MATDADAEIDLASALSSHQVVQDLYGASPAIGNGTVHHFQHICNFNVGHIEKLRQQDKISAVNRQCVDCFCQCFIIDTNRRHDDLKSAPIRGIGITDSELIQHCDGLFGKIDCSVSVPCQRVLLGAGLFPQYLCSEAIKDTGNSYFLLIRFHEYNKSCDKENYLRGRECEIILSEVSARALKAAGMGDKLPDLAKLLEEYSTLCEQKDRLYAEYGSLKKRMIEYEDVKQNIHSILSPNRVQEQDKSL